MRKDTRRTDARRDAESLEDLVYRPRLAIGNKQVRGANALLAVPMTLLGYLVLGFIGWQVVQHSKTLVPASPKSVAIDLLDPGEGEAPQATTPAPVPAAGGPPLGAIEKPNAPPPAIPADTELVPEKQPTELPTQDLSGTAFPALPGVGPSGTGTGLGPGNGGTGEGTGTSNTGQGPAVTRYEYSPVKEKYRPPDPPYPPVAKMAGIQGTVLVEITVGVDGVPLSAHAIEGPMQLRAASEASAMKWRFEPVKENGVPVIGIWPLKFKWQLR